MKTERSILLKSDQLTKIRNNFRSLWLAVAKKRKLELLEKRKKILLCYSKNSEEVLSSLLEEINTIQRFITHSICMCGWCHSTQRNMRFSVFRNQWFCIECYSNISP